MSRGLLYVPTEIDDRLVGLSSLKKDSFGYLIGKKQEGDYEHCLAVVAARLMRVGFELEGLGKRIEILAEFMVMHDDYKLVEFIVHGEKTRGNHGQAITPGERGYMDQASKNPGYVGLIVAGRTKIVFGGYEVRFVKRRFQGTPLEDSIAEEFSWIAEQRGITLRKFRGSR